jgi:hypothetical protein
MKRTPEQAARVAAWLNMLDHCEAQLQGLGALPEGRDALSAAREQVATLSHNMKTVIEANAARKERAVARAHWSRETIARLEREVAGAREAERLSGERRREILTIANMLGCDWSLPSILEAVKTLQVAAHAEGNDCLRVRIPRNGGPQVSLDGVTWHDQKTGRKV